MSLMDALVGARLVRADEEGGYVLAWFGGHAIHIYNSDGQSVGLLNVGDFSKKNATPEEVERAMDKLINGEVDINIYS